MEGVDVANLDISVLDGNRRKAIVSDLSFVASPGIVTGLAGPSGSGKTTVLTCLAGITIFDRGNVSVGGQKRRAGSLAEPHELRHVGIVFQDYHLMKALTVLDNVALPLRIAGMRWRQARVLAHQTLVELGIDALASSYPTALSGGQQQRVAIGRAMVTNPSVILADEPTAHLDANAVASVAKRLHALADRGVCVLASSHDPRLLERCHQIVHLSERDPGRSQ